MDPRKTTIENLPGGNLAGGFGQLDDSEIQYLYNLTEDEDFTELAYARAKDMAVDILMTNYVQVYKYEDAVMAADIVAPVKKVRSRTGSYKKRTKESLDVSVSDEGSQDGGTNEIMMKVGTGTYSAEIRKLKIFISDDEISEKGVLDPFQEATILLRHGIDLRQEIRIRNLADATSLEATPGTDWDTSAAVNTDIAAAKNAFILANGQPATHILFNYDVGNQLLANASQKAGVFGAVPSPMDGPGILDWQDASQLARKRPWGLIPIITNVMYSTAVGPGTTVVPAYVWPDDAFLFRVDKSARSTTWGIQMELMPKTIIRWRDEDRGGWFLKIVQKRDEIEATASAIYQLLDVT